MNDWLRETNDALAALAGTDAAGLTDDEARALLDLARVASHTSGDRTNAPLLCYLIGRLAERSPSVTIESMRQEIVRRSGAS